MGWENVRTWLLAAVATLAILSALYIARPSPTHAEGPTFVSGIISTPTTWTVSGSPYVVTGNILVTRTVTLTVEPGVTVKFDGPYYLRVDGALKAIGTPSQPITFTSNKASPARGDWGSVRFSPGSASATFDSAGNYLDGCTLQYVTVEYGGAALSGWVPTAIMAAGDAAPFIMGSTVRKGYGYAIWVQFSAAKLISNTIEDNTAYGGAWGGALQVEGPAMILYNTIRNNIQFGGISVRQGPALVAHNVLISNTGTAIGGGILLSNGRATIVSNTISGNSANAGGGIYVSGGSIITVSGNIIAGNRTGGSFRNGAGVLIEEVALGVLEGNVIRGNVAYGRGGGIYNASSMVTVTLNDISDNVAGEGGGLYLASRPGRLSFNNITGNAPTALHNAAAGQVSAPYDYWGTTDTSVIDAAIYDYYDDFDKGIVSYAPVLTHPISLPLRETFVPFVAQNRISGW